MLNTLLPFPSFEQSAQCLDRQRLGYQRIQVIQLLHDCLHTKSKEPIVQMWRPYTPSLAKYGIKICAEWKSRGYIDNCFKKILTLEPRTALWIHYLPEWLGNEEFHDSHKSYLLRKYPDHYVTYFKGTSPDIPLKFYTIKGS